MQKFLTLDLATQRVAIEQAAAAKGLPSFTVEKDFWVCWTLEQLFQLPEIGDRLTFKGGTSLSKVWGLIQRFSEDIDLVVDKVSLGASGENDPEEVSLSGTQRKKRIEALMVKCADFVRVRLQAELNNVIQKALKPGGAWSLTMDPQDKDQQTLLFNYPRLGVGEAKYMAQSVKIELGARSAIEPAQPGTVRSEVATAFPQLFDEPAVTLRALRPERTFLEKVALLHEEFFRSPDKPRKKKLARHYYDVARLIQAGVGDQALATPGLFEGVVAHRQIYFKQTKVEYETMAHGTLHLVPDESGMAAWASDYIGMQQEMLYGTPPTWEEIITEVAAWEKAFNQQ